MTKRHMTAREENVLTRMTLNLFEGIARIMADGDVHQLDARPDKEIEEFGRICLAFLEGKDIMFSNPSNKGNI